MLALSTCSKGAVDRHFDLFSRPYRQSDGLACRLADLQRDSLLLEGFETCRLHRQRVGTGRQKREGEIAFVDRS